MIKEIIKVAISDNKTYPIIIGDNILSQTGSIIKPYTNASKVLIVSNQTIFDIYGEKVLNSLNQEGFSAEKILLQDGEKFKNIKSLESIWDKALELKLERKDTIIALGGGVIGDISGFAASSILRGIDFIQIPTTLLAMVDSSVGGKTGINRQQGKNLIGAFYQPKIVLSDIDTLNTLPKRQLKVGLAEVLKYGFIEKTCDLNNVTDFIEFLQKNQNEIFNLNSDIMTNLIKHCCELKAAVVEKDEKEQGLRTILNFGHTIGHAIEKCTEYKIFNHGEAVALGMKAAFYIAKTLNYIDDDYTNMALNLITDYEMDYKIPDNIDKENIYKAMFSDKKVLSGNIRFILSTAYANVDIFDKTDENIIKSAIKQLY